MRQIVRGDARLTVPSRFVEISSEDKVCALIVRCSSSESDDDDDGSAGKRPDDCGTVDKREQSRPPKVDCRSD